MSLIDKLSASIPLLSKLKGFRGFEGLAQGGKILGDLAEGAMNVGAYGGELLEQQRQAHRAKQADLAMPFQAKPGEPAITGEPIHGVMNRGRDAREAFATDLARTFAGSDLVSNHLYHTTPRSNLESIKKEGLVTGKTQRHPGVASPNKIHLAASEDLAAYYGTSDDVMIRIKDDYVFDDLEVDYLGGGQGTYVTGKHIPPDALEIFENGKWVPIRTFAGADLKNATPEQIEDFKSLVRSVNDVWDDVPKIKIANLPVTDKGFNKWLKDMKVNPFSIEDIEEIKGSYIQFVLSQTKATDNAGKVKALIESIKDLLQ